MDIGFYNAVGSVALVLFSIFLPIRKECQGHCVHIPFNLYPLYRLDVDRSAWLHEELHHGFKGACGLAGKPRGGSELGIRSSTGAK